MLRVVLRIRNYFGFSKTETQGFVVLGILMIFILLTPLVYSYLMPSLGAEVSREDQQKLDSLLAHIEKVSSASSEQNFSSGLLSSTSPMHTPIPAGKEELFPFNPNEASEEALLRLGLPRWIVRNLIKYRAKGGKFRKKKDLLKIYNFPKDKYLRLEPYILLPDAYAYNPKKSTTKREYTKKYERKFSRDTLYTSRKIERFDLNRVDQDGLRQIRGIGEVLSSRIIAYRQKLGGFVRLEQIAEIYGLKPEVQERMHQYGFLDETPLKKLDINQMNSEELSNHPYLSKNLARAIVNYREQHGKFSTIDDLQRIKLINSEILYKLAPYLSL